VAGAVGLSYRAGLNRGGSSMQDLEERLADVMCSRLRLERFGVSAVDPNSSVRRIAREVIRRRYGLSNSTPAATATEPVVADSTACIS
jgi:hypothetical protein